MQSDDKEGLVNVLNAVGVLANNETDEDVLNAMKHAVKNLVYDNEEALNRAKELGFVDLE